MFVIRAIYGGDSFPYSTNPYFNDVPRFDQYGNPVLYFPHVQRMYELGITTGCATPGAFCPFDSTLNYMAAVFTVRAAQYKAGNPLYIDPSVSRPDNYLPTSSSAWFVDVPSYYDIYRYVQKIRDLGITTGCAPGYFCPNDVITRGQMTYYIVRGILDEFPPPTGLTSNPKLASGASLHGNAGSVPLDIYTSLNSSGVLGACSRNMTIRQCTQVYLANLYKQGVRELRFFFGVRGSFYSTALDANGNVNQSWLNNLGLFLADVRAAGITHVTPNFSLWGTGDGSPVAQTVQDCNLNSVTRYFWITSPFAAVVSGGGYVPDNSYPQDSYNCSPHNPFFIGWGKIYNLVDKVLQKAVEKSLVVYELETLPEWNSEDFTIYARFVYDNKHGTPGTPCEINRVWQDSPTVQACMQRAMQLNGFPPGAATISVMETRTSNGWDCDSVYGDKYRVVGLSGLNAAFASGFLGRTGTNNGGLFCGGETRFQESLPYDPQPLPSLIDMHSYVCVGISEWNLDCDLTKTGSLIGGEFTKLSNAINSFRNTRWPGASIVFGETHNNDVLNDPGSGHQGDVQCLPAPLSAPVDMVNGFNASYLAGQSIAFRPFAILAPNATCVPWPPTWSKGNGPYATQ